MGADVEEADVEEADVEEESEPDEEENEVNEVDSGVFGRSQSIQAIAAPASLASTRTPPRAHSQL